MKGGYQIISLGNTAITTGTEVTIAGVYDRIEANHGKPILFEDIILDSAELPAIFTSPVVDGTSFVLWFGVTEDGFNRIITVAEDDGVTVTVIEVPDPEAEA